MLHASTYTEFTVGPKAPKDDHSRWLEERQGVLPGNLEILAHQRAEEALSSLQKGRLLEMPLQILSTTLGETLGEILSRSLLKEFGRSSWSKRT